MKPILVFLPVLFVLDGYCRDTLSGTFTYTPNDAGSVYLVQPDFEELSVKDKEEALFSLRDKSYMRRICYGIVNASIPQHKLESLSIDENTRSTISFYLDSDGNVIYAYFTLLKKDKQILSDDDLYTLYQNLKFRPMNMAKLEIISMTGRSVNDQEEPDKKYYSRITVPIIPYGVYYAKSNAPGRRTVNLMSIDGALQLFHPFPELTLRTVDGDTIETSSLKGKVVMYNFYAPNNPICVAESKGLNQLYKKCHKKEIVFISVAFAGDDAIRKFNAKHRQGFKPVSWAENDLDKLVRLVGQYPTNVVVGPTGRIMLVRTGGTADSDFMKKRMMDNILPVIQQELNRAKK